MYMYTIYIYIDIYRCVFSEKRKRERIYTELKTTRFTWI